MNRSPPKCQKLFGFEKRKAGIGSNGTLAEVQLLSYIHTYIHTRASFEAFQPEADVPGEKDLHAVLLHFTRAMGATDRIVVICTWLD